MPTFILFKNGAPVDNFKGAVPAKLDVRFSPHDARSRQLKKTVQELLNGAASK